MDYMKKLNLLNLMKWSYRMEEKVKKAFKNLSGYTIKATEKAILELDKSILDKKNESVKKQLEERQKELNKDLETIRNYLERY